MILIGLCAVILGGLVFLYPHILIHLYDYSKQAIVQSL